MIRCMARFGLVLCFCGCRAPVAKVPLFPGDATAPSQVTPKEAIAIAEQLSSHPWQPFSKNILHGKDRGGILVNTPDVGHEPGKPRRGWWMPGVVNEGVPYKWGGFDDGRSFDRGIREGHAADDVSSSAKRRVDNAGVSRYAVGLDCSGFVSKCLKLPAVHDTARLPSVCEQLDRAELLRPGDLLNIRRRHVMLVAGWAEPDHSWVYYYETGGGPQ